LSDSEKFDPERRDAPDGASRSRRTLSTDGLILLFGSGEMSPTGRKIQEDVLKLAKFASPVKIGILETPTGFEVTANNS